MRKAASAAWVDWLSSDASEVVSGSKRTRRRPATQRAQPQRSCCNTSMRATTMMWKTTKRITMRCRMRLWRKPAMKMHCRTAMACINRSPEMLHVASRSQRSHCSFLRLKPCMKSGTRGRRTWMCTRKTHTRSFESRNLSTANFETSDFMERCLLKMGGMCCTHRKSEEPTSARASARMDESRRTEARAFDLANTCVEAAVPFGS